MDIGQPVSQGRHAEVNLLILNYYINIFSQNENGALNKKDDVDIDLTLIPKEKKNKFFKPLFAQINVINIIIIIK